MAIAVPEFISQAANPRLQKSGDDTAYSNNGTNHADGDAFNPPKKIGCDMHPIGNNAP